MMLNRSILYLLDSIFKYFFKRSKCPYCGTTERLTTTIDRKYLFTSLRECKSCHLLYRYPTDSKEEGKKFYQKAYSQGYTTDCPSEDELIALKKINFKNTERDYSRYKHLFDLLGIAKNAKILDYGCSWGYGVYQFREFGYKTEGYEISKHRAEFAQQWLGVKVEYNIDHIGNNFDVFFSSHVLEHVSDLKEVFELSRKLLKKNGGYFIAVTPNGSPEFRKKSNYSFHKLWGKVHPILLSNEFVESNFQTDALLLTSYPESDDFDLMLSEWSQKKHEISNLSGWELLIVAKY